MLTPKIGTGKGDLWAEFRRRVPFGRRFSSKYSVKASAVGSTSSFSTEELFYAWNRKHSGMRDDVA
jgi:hypothetical protein